MGETSVEIICRSCGEESLLKRMPRYEGFKRVGEILTCAACGYEYASEADVPFKQRRAPRVFDTSDAPKTVRVFRDEEKGRLCRYCRQYVVNPFTQRCARHRRFVEATDSCEDFEPKASAEAKKADPS